MESKKDFISRMVWLVSEINASEKGSSLDAIKLLEYHLSVREALLGAEALKKLRMHIYENVDGNKAKVVTSEIDIYENRIG